MPGIEVTLCIKNTVTEFLDTVVYKNPIGLGESELCTSVFFIIPTVVWFSNWKWPHPCQRL